MAEYMMGVRDYEGYGLYEYAGGYGLGAVPNLAGLSDYEMRRGLAHVRTGQKPILKAALQSMVFTPDMATTPGVSGRAQFILGSGGSPWVDDFVRDGYVVMVERNFAGTVKVMATSLPAAIVLFSGGDPPAYVIVDYDPGALAAAEAYRASGGAPTPTPGGTPFPLPGGLPGGIPGDLPIPGGGGCPPGSAGIWPYCTPTGVPEPTPGGVPEQPPAPGAHRPPCDAGDTLTNNWCYPPPGGVEPEPAPTAKGLPKWVLPAAGATAVVALLAVVLSGKKRSAPSSSSARTVRSAEMAANRRMAWR